MINEATPQGFFAWLDALPPSTRFNSASQISNVLARHLKTINPHIQQRIYAYGYFVSLAPIRWNGTATTSNTDHWREVSRFEIQLGYALDLLPDRQTAAQLQKRLSDLRPTENDDAA